MNNKISRGKKKMGSMIDWEDIYRYMTDGTRPRLLGKRKRVFSVPFFIRIN
jgi:hypothetical protein